MEYTQELSAALKELERITGIRMNVAADTPEQAELALSQVRCLCTAYKEKYDKTHFLQSLFTGNLTPYDISERARRLHIEPDVSRTLFLLETASDNDNTVSEVIKHLFPSPTKTFLVPVSDHIRAILRPMKQDETAADIEQIAHTIVDTLNMEALVSVQVAYSSVLKHLSEAAEAFRDTSLTLSVGKIFYSGQTVFPPGRLGIGRLIYQLPIPTCKDFLHEIFGSNIPEYMDKDFYSAVETFFSNSFNISETARQLHMHRNTLIYRLDMLQKHTGLDIRKFEDAMTFKIASMIMNYLEQLPTA